MKRILCYLLALVAVGSLFVACGDMGGAGGLKFVINNATEPQTLDPAKITGVPEHRIYMALFEGLVINDPKTSKAMPGIAESWAFNADNTVITFKLRDANWSDGTKITAKTFVDSWLRTLDPKTASEYAYMVTMVVKGAEAYNTGKGKPEDVAIKAIDDKTLEVTLNGPIPYAIDMMAHYAFAPMPMHVIAKLGDEWVKAGNIVSNGPFVLKEWTPQKQLVVVKNAKYWDAKNVALGQITFLPIEDNNTGYLMFQKGEVDWQTTPPLDKIDEIALRKDFQVSPQVATYYYIFNVTRKPFDNVKVRNALAMAIDKKTLVEKVTKGGQMATDSMVPPMAGYTPAPNNPYNPEEAKKLLAAAGFPDGKGFPKVAILYNTSDNHKKIAEYIQDQWKKNLGIEVTLTNQEWKTFLDTRSKSHDFFIARAGWVGDYMDPNTFLDMFITGSGLNDGLYSNAEYDKLVKQAATMKDGPERMSVLAQAEKIFTTESGTVPIYHYVNQDLIDLSKWDGWYPNPLGVHDWKFLAPKKK